MDSRPADTDVAQYPVIEFFQLPNSLPVAMRLGRTSPKISRSRNHLVADALSSR